MRLRDHVGFAAAQLLRNKGRTALTATGVAVGVFAFTSIVAIGRGLETAVIEQLTDDESPTRVVVRPGFGALPPGSLDAAVQGVADPAKADRLRKAIAKRRRGGPGPLRRTLLTPDAVEGMRGRPHVTAVRPLVIDRFELTLGDHAEAVAISYGVAADDPRWQARVIAGQPLADDAHGVWLHEFLLYTWGYRSDEEQAALVGREVRLGRPSQAAGASAMLEAARRSGVDVPIDPRMLELLVRMGTARTPRDDGDTADPPAPAGVALPLLGVVRERVEDDGFEMVEDSFSMQADLFLPQGLAEALFLQDPSNLARGYTAATLEVADAEQVGPVERGLRADGWNTSSVRSILERLTRALALITVIVAGLTSVAVLVAVLGIVNTMIMNVSERTREIGTLKALGASDRQVRGLFVVESGLIGLLGGAVGLAAALLGSFPGDWAARAAIQRMTEYSYPGSVFAFPAWLLVAALGFALVLSVLAALGPARVASRVDPVVALRDE
ncbi:MAG: ABC transporter permease [Planctomycetes bacterium]|nr:ABC transporter permease [Planctomycetota bacterium]